MKIGAIPEALQFLNIVRERKGGDLPDQGKGRQKKQNQDEEEKPRSREELNDAAQAFTADAQAQANGLSAEVAEGENNNPAGLKVVLRDRKGIVLREMGGEEFLRMREIAQAEPLARGRGKILDQKL